MFEASAPKVAVTHFAISYSDEVFISPTPTIQESLKRPDYPLRGNQSWLLNPNAWVLLSQSLSYKVTSNNVVLEAGELP